MTMKNFKDKILGPKSRFIEQAHIFDMRAIEHF